MRAARLLLAACCVTALLACGDDDPLELGAQCEFTTECTEPYVCRIGRCRVECVSSRDCPPGAVCLEDNEGRGACRLPPEAECTSDGDCPSILVCGEGQCRNECTEDTDCPDGTCEELAPELRTCAEPVGADAGPGDAGSPTDGGLPPVQTCRTTSDCDTDESCDSLRGEPSICRPTCDAVVGDSDCPGESICMQTSDAVSIPGVCTHACTLDSSEGCPSDTFCDLFSETRSGSDKVFFTECRAVGPGDVCTPCTPNDATECVAGTTCTFHDGRRRCMDLCVDSADCPRGESCDDFSDAPTFDGVRYGRCIPATSCDADAGT